MWTCPQCGGTTEDGFDICWTCRVPASQSTDDEVISARTIVTTTPTLETHVIVKYFGPVFGETIWGANAIRDFAAGLTDTFGGRSSVYEEVLTRGRTQAIVEMKGRAERMGANAVVDLRVTYDLE